MVWKIDHTTGDKLQHSFEIFRSRTFGRPTYWSGFHTSCYEVIYILPILVQKQSVEHRLATKHNRTDYNGSW